MSDLFFPTYLTALPTTLIKPRRRYTKLLLPLLPLTVTCFNPNKSSIKVAAIHALNVNIIVVYMSPVWLLSIFVY